MPAAAKPVPGPAHELIAGILTEARNLAGLGLFEEAAALCEAAVPLAAGDPGLMAAIGGQLLTLRQPLRASSVLEVAARDPAAPPAAHADLVTALIQLGRASQAEAAARRGIGAVGETGALLCGLGSALRHQGEANSALATLRRAVASPESIPAAHGEFALALMAAGRLSEAVKEQATARYLAGSLMAGRHVGAYRPAAVASWSRRNGSRCATVIPATTGRAFQPHYGDEPGRCRYVALPQPEVYLAELEDVSIIGGQQVVLTADGSALLDQLFRPNAERLDLAEPSVPYLGAGGVMIDVPAVAAETIPAGVQFQGFGVRNYYHWLVEYLPRLLLLERTGVPADVPLLVDKRTHQVPQLADALRAADRLGRRVVELEPDVEYRVGRLYVPSTLAWLAPNLRDGLQLEVGDNLIAPDAVAFIRERLVAGPNRTGGRRLYIARRAATSPTRLANESEVQAVFCEFGFEVVQPDGLSFGDQRTLFAETAVIASESGAGLTNVVLAPETATLICLQADEWPMNVYADLVGHAGQTALFVAGDVLGERPVKPYHARFTILPDRLRELLRGIEARG